MLDQKKRFRHESLQDKKTIQELLKSVAKSISKGKLEFSDEDGSITLHPKGLLNLKVTAGEEEGRQRLDIRISWQDEKTEPGKGNISVK